MDSGSLPLQVVPADTALPPSPLDAWPPVDSSYDERPRLSDTDVVFHVINDAGADVFIDNRQPLVLELHGEFVRLDPGCGSACPSCACKECPAEPPQVRRIPDAGSWDEGWNRRVYVSQRCGGACPCTREVDAKPGSYTVILHGKRRANAARANQSLVFNGRLDEGSGDCQATASFKLSRGARVDLKLACD